MNKLITFLLLTTILGLCDQYATTDNGRKILLKNDGTWFPADAASGEIARSATTQAGRKVLLKGDCTWEYVATAKDTSPGAIYSSLVVPGAKTIDIADTTAILHIEDTLTEESTPAIKTVPYPIVEKKPKPVIKPIPKYPKGAKKAGIEGSAFVQALIDVDGSVIDATILVSTGSKTLDKAALEAVRNAKYEPGEHEGEKVRTWLSVPIHFKLR